MSRQVSSRLRISQYRPRCQCRLHGHHLHHHHQTLRCPDPSRRKQRRSKVRQRWSDEIPGPLSCFRHQAARGLGRAKRRGFSRFLRWRRTHEKRARQERGCSGTISSRPGRTTVGLPSAQMKRCVEPSARTHGGSRTFCFVLSGQALSHVLTPTCAHVLATSCGLD